MKKSLFGYAMTTKALAKFEQNSEIWDIYDDSFKEASKDEFGNNLLPVKDFDPFESALEIPSPGFPFDHDLVKKAKNLISEYDYFFDASPLKVWVSGTNGKTTTAQMLNFILSDVGSKLGGNVGNPLATMDKKANIWVLETSSFTMHYTKRAFPEVYALLPVTPDHLTWHKTMEHYVNAKLKPLSMMKKGAVAILPKEYENIPTEAKIISYKDESDLAKFCAVELDDIKFKVPFLMDALVALSVEKVLFDRVSLDKLNNFKIEAHKLEEIFDKKNRLWVNDSKATNIDACRQALKRFKDKKIHLILGGDDKGVDLNGFFAELKNYDLVVYAIGSNSDKIVDLSKKNGIEVIKCDILENSVKEIDKALKDGEVALLSPACASLDQFSSYAKRGDDFKEFVSKL